MIRVKRYVLLDLDVKNSLQQGKSVADTGYAELFQVLVLHFYEGFSVDGLICAETACQWSRDDRLAGATYQ